MLARDLPFDILGEVFVQCLPTSPQEKRRASVKTAPMLLCQICSTWRKAALGHPQLWAHLCLRRPITVNRIVDCRKGRPDEVSDERYIDPQSLAFFGWWMGNAGTIPMCLYVASFHNKSVTRYLDEKGHYISGFRPDEDAQTLPQFLSTTFRSVVHLELRLGGADLHDLCVNLAPTAFWCLESLTLQSYNSRRVPGRYLLPPAPLLRHIHLSRFQDLQSVRWIRLTRLCISGLIKEGEWLDLLKNCENLVSAAIRIDTVDIHFPRDNHGRPSSPHFSPIEHTSLQQLVIAPTTFDSVYFPALKALSIIVPQFTWCAFNSFTGLAALLRATPHLTELHIGARLFDSETMYNFRYEVADGSACPLSVLLPDLERLVFEQVGYWTGEDIVKLLKSGWMGIFPRNGRIGQVDLVFLTDPKFSDKSKEQDREIVHEIQDYLAERKDLLGYEVHLQHPIVPKDSHTPYQISKDFARWDEAMGFYHRCSEEVI